jgi:hypothetical protein
VSEQEGCTKLIEQKRPITEATGRVKGLREFRLRTVGASADHHLKTANPELAFRICIAPHTVLQLEPSM